jgi:hypothetical protein
VRSAFLVALDSFLTEIYLLLTPPLLISSPLLTTGCHRQSDMDLAEAKQRLMDLTAEVARLKEQMKTREDIHAHLGGLRTAPESPDPPLLSLANNKSGSSSSSSCSKDDSGCVSSSSSSSSSSSGSSSRFSFELLREMPSIDGKVCRIITMNRTDDAVLLSSYRSISTPAGPIKQYHVNRVRDNVQHAALLCVLSCVLQCVLLRTMLCVLQCVLLCAMLCVLQSTLL